MVSTADANFSFQGKVSKEFKAEAKSTKTTIPFLKNNEFDYAELLSFLGKDYKNYAWLIFIPIVIFIITAVSNGANLTDGIDGFLRLICCR